MHSVIRIACLCAAINLALGAFVLASDFPGAPLAQHSAKISAPRSSS